MALTRASKRLWNLVQAFHTASLFKFVNDAVIFAFSLTLVLYADF